MDLIVNRGIEPKACYLFATTYHLPPTTYHLPPSTYHLAPTTYHLPPTTYHLPPTTYTCRPLTSDGCLLAHRNAISKNNAAPIASSATSFMSLPREGTKLWWNSSSAATARHTASACRAQRICHPANAPRQARSHISARIPYSVTCAALRVRKWIKSKRSRFIGPKILGRTYSRMLPVCFSENASLDAINTSAVHSSAGSQ